MFGHAAWMAGLVLSCAARGAQIELDGPRPTEPATDRRGRAIPACLVADDTSLRAAPSVRAPQHAVGRFLDSYYLLRMSAGRDGRRYCLLGTLTPDRGQVARVAGWAAEDDCLVGSTALRAQEGAYRKAVIVRPWRTTEAARRHAPVVARRGPDARHGPAGELALFRFFFVYKTCGKGDETRYLVGGRPQILPEDRPEETLAGWVAAANVVAWDSRVAVQFCRSNRGERTEPAGLFASDDDLSAWRAGRGRAPLAEERLDVGPWEPGRMRFPLLGARASADGRTRLLEVAFVADQFPPSVRPPGPPAAPGDGAVREIDLVVAIDASGSMQRRMAHVAEAIRKSVDAVCAELAKTQAPTPQFQFSIVFFRDYHDGEEAATRLPTVRRLSDAVATIRSHRVRLGQGGDPNDPNELTEAVFHGACYALEHARFRPRSYRQLLVVGDRGNHRRDPRGYSEQRVVEALRAADANLIAVHVASPTTFDVDPDALLFKQQMERIAAALKHSRGRSLFGAYFCQPKPQAVGELIALGFREAVRNSDRIRATRAALAATRPARPEPRPPYGVRLTDQMVRAMAEAGVRPDSFSPDHVRVHETGWIAERHPRLGLRQAERVLLVRRDELELLAAVLDGLVARPRPGRQVRDAWKKVLERHLGLPADDRVPLRELLASRLPLPLRDELFGRTLCGLNRLGPRELAAIQARLRASRDRLRQHIEGNATPPWFQVARVDYAWLPLDALP